MRFFFVPFMWPLFRHYIMKKLAIMRTAAVYSGALLFLPTGLPAVALTDLYVRYVKRVKPIHAVPYACFMAYVYLWPVTIPLSILSMPFYCVRQIRAKRRAHRVGNLQHFRGHLLRLKTDLTRQHVEREYAVQKALRGYPRDWPYRIVIPNPTTYEP